MKYLLVPIQLDALHMRAVRSVVEAMANFSRLPYFDRRAGVDINSSIPYLGESLSSPPFNNEKPILGPGLHLHWTLPDALTRGDLAGESAVFPPVPTRWLVTRQDNFGTRQWLVESDYLYPPLEPDKGIAYKVHFPLHTDPASGLPPFRYLGRATPLEEWPPPEQPGEEYLYQLPAVNKRSQSLTAVGYGEPTFAAFYPNCLSVFGFNDPQPPDSLTGTVYTVAGWYGNPEDDPCYGGVTPAELETEHGWQLPEGKTGEVERVLCYARLTMAGDGQQNQDENQGETTIAIGNTPTEALSAYLARDPHFWAAMPVDSQGREIAQRQFEDQLEALHLAPALEHRRVDVGPKFREARHEKGFNAVPAGHIWTIRPVQDHNQRANAAHAPVQVTLPDEDLALLLNRLNLAQADYDASLFEIETLRERLYADWYRYMLSAYPPDDLRNDTVDPDAVRDFILRHDINPLDKAIHDAGLLALRRGENDRIVSAFDKSAVGESLAAKVADLVTEILNTLPGLNTIYQQDIPDWPAFIRALHAAPESLVQTLGGHLPQDPAASLTTNETEIIISILNDLLQEVSLSELLPIPTNQLSAEGQLIAQKDPLTWEPGTNIRFNRLLLEAILPPLTKRPLYLLQHIAAPRYWEPNEPVVLIDGPLSRPSSARHGPDRELACSLFDLQSDKPANNWPDIAAELDRLAQDTRIPKRAFRQWTGQPWHPFLLEWEVELNPTADSGNLDPDTRAYRTDFLKANYLLAEHACELTYRDNKVSQLKGRAIYTGRSVLTGYAQLFLRDRAIEYLQRELLPAYFQAHPDLKEAPDYLADRDHLQVVSSWYSGKAESERDVFITRLLDVLGHLQDFQGLAQSLSGFNAALLGHKQSMQLPLAEPLGFPPYQEFTKRVAGLVGAANRVAPQPANDFNPIRSGVLTLRRLSLVDSFGQRQDVPITPGKNIVAADSLDLSTGDAAIYLPPRFVQPARINLRWLSARHISGHSEQEVEMNSHPATSPICGWVVPNNLDLSLLFYDQQGAYLGQINLNGEWNRRPGGQADATVMIANPHLQRVVDYIISQAGQEVNYVPAFVATLDSALENIDPESFAAHEARALLMGRPLAIVRASIKLEQRGLPAINQDWTIFRQELNEDARPDTDEIRSVEIPLRLGEHRQLNDGLAGYWIEGSAEVDTLSAPFYSPQRDPEGGLPDDIRTYASDQADAAGKSAAAEKMNMTLTLDKPRQYVTMLVDPRGSVHATCGILPTKSIHIPADQFAAALQAIEVSFFTAPILIPAPPPKELDPQGRPYPQIPLPLPQEPGYTWTWADAEDQEMTLGSPSRQADFNGPHTLIEGWLVLRRANKDTKTGSNGQQAPGK